MTTRETADEKQNITLRLKKATIRKARILAAKRSTSISGLISNELEQLVARDDEYEKAMQDALAMMKPGFALGGSHKLNRDALHER
jgi:hypothetical protein